MRVIRQKLLLRHGYLAGAVTAARLAAATVMDASMTSDAIEHPTATRRNLWVLTAAQSLGANAPIVISLGGLVG